MSAPQIVQAAPPSESERLDALTRVARRLHISNNIALAILWGVTGFVTLLFVAIIVYLILRGFSTLIDPDFYAAGVAGVGQEIFNTFYILILTELFLFPIALAAAIYLVEYARQGPFVTVIHFAAETLAGVPSLVLGLFGVLAFSDALGLHTSRLAGALTLLCLNLPLALRLFEDALSSVSRDLREGGLALGSTRWHMIRTLVIPSALPGLITGLILSAGKVIGEAAALLFTMGLNNPANVFTLNPLIASDTLTTHLYFITGPGGGSTSLSHAQELAISAGSSALLIILLLLINVIARSLGRYIQRRVTAA
jgi:phosphate transport system permease protein